MGHSVARLFGQEFPPEQSGDLGAVGFCVVFRCGVGLGRVHRGTALGFGLAGKQFEQSHDSPLEQLGAGAIQPQ